MHVQLTGRIMDAIQMTMTVLGNADHFAPYELNGLWLYADAYWAADDRTKVKVELRVTKARGRVTADYSFVDGGPHACTITYETLHAWGDRTEGVWNFTCRYGREGEYVIETA